MSNKNEVSTAKKKGFKGSHADIEFKGDKIILPANCTLARGIDMLVEAQKDQESEIRVHEVVNVHPFDGAYCFMQAIRELYGWATTKPTPGFFGPNPPTYKTIDSDWNKKVEIIWGAFSLPDISGQLQTGYDIEQDTVRFCIQGTVRKKSMPAVARLVALTREWARLHSIYKGKAIILPIDRDGDYQPMEAPKFFHSDVEVEDLIFSDDVQEQIDTHILTPIRYSEACRANNIPLSRGILLEGPYGTGKTLTAAAAARVCVENGWTFILLGNARELEHAVKYAMQYSPAFIFAEDIDRCVGGQRSEAMDRILNTVDGILKKTGVEIITALTTNNVEGIHPAMLRPGRLDAVISLRKPDAAAAMRLLRKYGGAMLDPNSDLTEAGKACEDKIPAVIREIIERSKMHAINRLQGAKKVDGSVTGEDIVRSANSMDAHLKLVNRDTKAEPDDGQKIGLGVAAIVKKEVGAELSRHFN